MKPLHQRVLRNLGHPLRLTSWGLYQFFRGNDYRFVSMPCSGTHWLRFMLARSLVEYFDLDYEFTDIKAREIVPSFRVKTDRFAYNDRTEIPRIQHCHDYYSPLYWNSRVILLIRDLRDSLASHYERYSSWIDPELTFSEFLREEGISPAEVRSLSTRIGFLNSWGKGRRRVSNFLTVRYEDMKEDPTGQLRKVLDFVGFDGVSDGFLESVVEFSSRENMRRIERESVSEERGTPKVNKATMDRHEPFFSESDDRFFRNYLRENLEYDFGYEYEPLHD